MSVRYYESLEIISLLLGSSGPCPQEISTYKQGTLRTVLLLALSSLGIQLAGHSNISG